MPKDIIETSRAPAAIGPYSQAVKVGNLVFISGQIPLDPQTMEIASSDIDSQVNQVFDNLAAICAEAGGGLGDVVKFTVYLSDLRNFGAVNKIMETLLTPPYPARAAVEVSALPRGALVEVDAILAL